MASTSAAAAAASGSSSANGAEAEMTPSGIPKAPFVVDVEAHIGGADKPVEPALRKFQEATAKYKYMEASTAQRRRGLEEKIPDIRKTLQMVEHLKTLKEEEQGMETMFELNDTLYAKAKIQAVETVNLWLGANVMLSYPLDEAIELLRSKLTGAEASLDSAKADLDFLREQITVMEVNTARCHNWDVSRRRRLREQQSKEEKDVTA
ncbi:hypothetical protein OC846_002052 [Tilletia horrida]|uniref:Prefoldin subunit 3 n=1 Tax=Tilletia horrida TaxID=155126 RepID=A0AAN6JTB1_9BASI|nr:hypothetical protein OC846_002052 [Tilletia horrida]KAK0568264.1 hypothetical protein OC861_002128 [Tilletia horrida]